jgi:RNA ligase
MCPREGLRERPALRLDELFDPAELTAAIEAGLVKVEHHLRQPLVIFNYTARCQWEGAWNSVTRQCRGLIADESGVVVARPWPKFFNYGDHPAGSIDLASPAEVTDKVDGSLGVLYRDGNGWAIATRGSFVSEQAGHATALLRERYPRFEPPEGRTVLFEIVYRGNRVIVDYGDADDLVLLGAVDIATGGAVGPAGVPSWEGPAAAAFSVQTLAGALALPPRPNAEGMVARLPGGLMLKIKQDDYVALHRLVTGLNSRVVWERLGGGDTAADICGDLPDEFHAWVNEVAGELLQAQQRLIDATHAEHGAILAGLPEGWTRKDYALAAARSQLRPWLFLLLDGHDPAAKIWRTLRPSGERALVPASEDTS